MSSMFTTFKGKFTALAKIAIRLTVGLSVLLTGSVWANDDHGPGAVFAMTNNVERNEIVVYDRAADGMLTLAGTVATRGKGGIGSPPEPVDALGSQKPLILSKDKRWLLAVNAGSNEISVFRVRRNKLTLVDKVNSGGDFPVSLALHKNLLYVLNSGGDANISGFTLGHSGHLTPLPGSTRSLGAGGTNPPFFLVSPAQVGFGPKGNVLVVTEKGSNEIHVFSVDANGVPSAAPVSTLSNGFTPFGFAFDRRGHLIVVEAFGRGSQPPPPTPGAGATSSYKIGANGRLQVISASVENFQTATCWLEIDTTGRYAYATNNASHTITGYQVSKSGRLSLLNTDGVTAHTGEAPVDLSITGNGRYLYNVNAFSGTISMFRINKSDGSLNPLGEIVGLPMDAGAVGIAAY